MRGAKQLLNILTTTKRGRGSMPHVKKVMIHIMIHILLLACITTVFSQTNILIVGRSWQNQLDAWETHLESLGSVSVDIVTTTPADLSAYDQVWYADFQNWDQAGMASGTFEEPSNNAINNLLPAFIKTGGNIAFLTDHNASGSYAAPLQTQDQIEKFVATTTGDNSFKIHDKAVWWGPFNALSVIIDPLLNLDQSLIAKLGSKNYTAEACTAVLPSEIGTGIGVLEIKQSWAPGDAFIGVAFVGNSFTAEYQQGGRIFVFTDIFNALNNNDGNNDLLELIAGIVSGKDLTQAPIDLDTTGVAVTASRIVYDHPQGSDFIATVTTDDSVTIDYFINGSKSGTAKTSVAVNFKDLPDSVDLKAVISGTDSKDNEVLKDSTSWTFIRKIAAEIKLDTTATVVGLNPDPDTVTFNTVALPIYIESDGENISYTINGGTSQNYSGSFNLSSVSEDTITIEVTADGAAVLEAREKWVFVRKLPPSLIIATPSESTPKVYSYKTASLNVGLTVQINGTVYEASDSVEIWYTLGNQKPNKGDGATIKLNPGAEVTIRGDDTLRAIAFVTFADDPAEGMWYYDQDFDDATLNAIPSESPELLFGHTLDIVLESSADTIRFTRDGTPADKNSTLFIEGSDVITITDSDADTVVISGYAYSDTLTPVAKSWRYVRDTLPDLIADPAGTKFSKMLNIKLLFSEPEDPKWQNVKIYYTLNGDDPDTSSTLYSGNITIDTTTTLKAIAYADNRIESSILTEHYVLTASVTSAFYEDNDGDGAIDGATIKLSKDVSSLPNSVVLNSPFNVNESVNITVDEMKQINGNTIQVLFNTPFAYTEETGFEESEYGILSGDEYLDADTFTVSDSVAPVLTRAEYFAGKIDSTVNTTVYRQKDTLLTFFSEEVSINAVEEPFHFRQDGAPYTVYVDPNSITVDKRKALCIVEKLEGVTNPMPGDSLHIAPTGDISAAGVAQNHDDNRWVELTVHKPPYFLTIKAISPVNPSLFEIPSDLSPTTYKNENALVIVADFHMQLWSVEGMKAAISIMDPLGNTLATSEALESGFHLTSEVQNDGRTRVVFYWDGRNTLGRDVGSGTYVARVLVTPPGGKTEVRLVNLGVSRKSGELKE